MKPHYDAVAPRFKAWETPPDFFKKLDEEFGFTLDAAASHENHLCECYLTVNGYYREKPCLGAPDCPDCIEADKCLDPDSERLSELDGLKHGWTNERVFCNPPYDSTIPQWVDKAFQFEAEVAVLLLPPSFDTVWGQRIWEAYLDRSKFEDAIENPDWYTKWPSTVEIRLPPGRLRFYRPAFAPGFGNLGMYGEIDPLTQTPYGERIFDYSKPHVPGEAPRTGNLVAIFRK